jgi:hypothetical protein
VPECRRQYRTWPEPSLGGSGHHTDDHPGERDQERQRHLYDQSGGLGQNKVLVGPSVTPVIFPAAQIKNGNLSFTISNTLTAPAMVTAAEAGCPNDNWTGVNPVLTLTSISLVIEQPVGTVIFTCTASDPLSGTVALSCS